jgi:hypothetical protein
MCRRTPFTRPAAPQPCCHQGRQTVRTGTARYDHTTRTLTITADDGEVLTIEHIRLPGNLPNTLGEYGWTIDPDEPAWVPLQEGEDLRVVSYPEPENQQEVIDSWVHEYGEYESHVKAAVFGPERDKQVVRFLVIIIPDEPLTLETPDPNGRLFERASAVKRSKPYGERVTLREMLTGWPPSMEPDQEFMDWLLMRTDDEER